MAIWGTLTLLICLVLLKTLLNTPSGFPHFAGLCGKIGILLSIIGAIITICIGVIWYMFLPSSCTTFMTWLNIMISYSGYSSLLIMIGLVAAAGGEGVKSDPMSEKLTGHHDSGNTEGAAPESGDSHHDEEHH
jgi:hypothetical protein